MFATNWIGKATSKKATLMKCKLDTKAGVHVLPLSTYQKINPSKLDKKAQPISGYGHDRIVLKVVWQ